MMYSFLFRLQLTKYVPYFLNPHNKKSFISKAFYNLFSFVFCCLMLSGCDKAPDNLVNQNALDYQVTGITAPDTVNYAAQDSVVTTSLQISNPGTVKNVWCSVSSLDGTNIIFPQVLLNTTTLSGTGTTQTAKSFSGTFIMNKNLAAGQYQIEYYVENNVWLSPQNLINAGSKIFIFQNGTPPVISINSMPNSVSTDSSFVVSVKAISAKGLKDISQVYFRLYTPGGVVVDPGNGLGYFVMNDDGKLSTDGDQTAGDGIYSAKQSFKTGSLKGSWRFEFQAKDIRGGLSNVIIHNIVVN